MTREPRSASILSFLALVIFFCSFGGSIGILPLPIFDFPSRLWSQGLHLHLSFTLGYIAYRGSFGGAVLSPRRNRVGLIGVSTGNIHTEILVGNFGLISLAGSPVIPFTTMIPRGFGTGRGILVSSFTFFGSRALTWMDASLAQRIGGLDVRPIAYHNIPCLLIPTQFPSCFSPLRYPVLCPLLVFDSRSLFCMYMQHMRQLLQLLTPRLSPHQ